MGTVDVWSVNVRIAQSVPRTSESESRRSLPRNARDGETHLAMGSAHAYSGEPELALAEFTKAEQYARFTRYCALLAS